MADLIDNLCQATQIIVDKAIEELKFDKTVTGKIIDNSKANIGEYTIKEGVVEYVAYSENTSYKIGDYAFANTKIKTCNIGINVVEIGERIF